MHRKICVVTINLAICSILDADRVYTTRKYELQIHPCAFSKCQKGNIYTCICTCHMIKHVTLITMHQMKFKIQTLNFFVLNIPLVIFQSYLLHENFIALCTYK